MNIETFLSSLSERDQIHDETGFWENSVKLSNAFTEQNPYHKELVQTVSELKQKTETLEQELLSNTESGQKMREIKALNQTIEEERQKIENSKLDENLLEQEVKNLNQEILPLREKVNSVKEQISNLKETLENLNHELKNYNEQQAFSKKALDSVTEDFSKNKMDEDKMIRQLMRLKEREMDIRNQDVMPEKVPTIDLSKYKAPLPTSTSGSSADNDNADLAGVKIEKVPFLSSLKQGESHTQKHNGSITALCFANTQPYMASGSEDTTVHVVKTDTFQRTTILRDSPKTIMSIAFSPSDRIMLTAAYDGDVRFYRAPDFKLQYTNSDNRECVTSAVFITEDKFVTCCRDQTIKLFDVSRSAPITSLTAASTAHCVFPLQGESLIITAHHDGKIRGYDLRAHGVPFEIRVHKKQAIQVTGRIGGTKAVSLSVDKTIATMDIRGRTVLGSVSIQQAGMPSDKMQMAVVDSSAIVGSTSGDIFDYDLQSYKLHSTSKGHNAPVFCVAANQSMGLLATGDKNGVVKFWNQ